MENLQLSQLTTNHSRPITLRLTDAELLEAFPEAKQIIPPLLNELRHRRVRLVDAIADRLAAIKAESTDESYRYFWRKWLAVTLGEELDALDRHIARLSRQLRIIKGLPVTKNLLTEAVIQLARDVPVEELLDCPTRRSGHDLVCVCPFHDERTPSFHIYTQENRGWCFGCNKGGDSIAIYMLLNDCDFKEAVMSLAGGRK
jgi:hypothetical protein